MNLKRIIAVALLACLGLFTLASAQSLGSASTFAILAGAGVTNTGPSIISGDVGVWPGSAITGFPPGTVVNGSFHVTDGPAAQAQADLAVAYTAIEGMPLDLDLSGQDLGGMVLSPGVYHFATSAQLTGILTLDAGGDPNAKWYFQIGSTLTAASNSAVIVIGGGSANNLFWQVGSSATIGTGTAFGGHILAFSSITLQTGATLGLGSALAQNGAVTLDTSIVSATVVAVLTPLISTNPPAGGTLIFGDVCLGEDKTLILDITNVGDGPLTISNLAPNGSGVMLSSPPVTPFDLAPGAHAYIDVTVTPTGTGPHVGSVVVTSNSGGSPGTTTTVNVSYNTPTGELALLPESLDFGPVCLNDAVTQDVDVYNVGNCDLTLLSVGNPANPAFTVEAPPVSVNIQPGDHATIPVTFTPTVAGTVSSSFIISTDNGNGLQNTAYEVTGEGVIPTIAASPTTLAFGNVCPGVPVQRTIQIRNTGDCPATISSIMKVGGVNPGSITLDNPALPATLPVGGTLLIDVTVNAQVNTGAISTTVRTNINDSVVNTDVLVTATVATGTIGLSPTALSFGNVCVGASSSKIVTIRNTGACDLTVNNVAITAGGGVYTVEPVVTPVVIAPNSSAPVTVVFTPTATGNGQAGVLTVTSNSGGVESAISNVPLTGDSQPGIIGLSPTALSYGNVCVGASSSKIVTIRNTGGCDLTVSNVAITAGGGVYTIEPVVTPLIIAGNSSAPVTVVFTPTAVGNGQAGVLTVTSNTGGGVAVASNVPLTGDSAPGVLSVSPTALDFGDVCVGMSGTKLLTLRNTGACDLTVSNVDIMVGDTVYSIEPLTTPVTIPRNGSIPVTVRFAPTTFGDDQTGVLTVTSDSGGVAATVTNVALTGDAPTGVLGVSPMALDFGTVCAGSTKSRNLTLRNTGDCDLTVSNVAITAGGGVYSLEPFTTPVIISRGGSTSVTVVFAPTTVGNGQTGVLTVTSNSGGEEAATTNVPLTGNAPAGVLAANPTALDFGSLCAGGSMTKSLQLRNTGGCDLTVSAATLAGAGAASYSLPADLILPFSLSPGGSITTQVTLSASAPAGANNAMLTFTTTDANTLVVALSANVSALPTVSVSGVSGAQSGTGTAANPYVVCVGALPAFTFTVAAADADGGNTVRLTESGVPSGANFTNVLPAMGNPVTTTVSITPSPAQGGESYAMTFTATDDSASTCNSSVTINLRVSSLPVISATPSTLEVCEGMPISYRVRASDPDPGDVTIGVPTITHTGGEGTPALNLVSTPGLPHSDNPAETVVTGTAPDVAVDTTYTLTYTVTDGDGCTATQAVTITVMDSKPTTLTMTRSPSGEISVGQQVCYTAVVRDNCDEPRLVAGVPVCFTVVSTTGNNTLAEGVHVVTNANGEAQYCLTPLFPGTVTVTAVIDFNGDCVADTGTTGATLNLTVQAPAPNDAGIYITGQGKVDAAAPVFNNAPAIAQFTLDISPKSNGSFKGKVNVLVPGAGTLPNGKKTSVKITSTRIDSVTMTDSANGRAVVIFGMVKVSGLSAAGLNGTRPFRADALDAGTPGIPNDIFTLTLLDTAGGVTVGPVGGHLGFGRGATNPKDDIKIRTGIRAR